MIKATDLIRKFREALDDNWGYIYGMTHVKWSEARQKNYNAAKKDDPNCQMSIRYGSKWYGHWVTDCSGLFAWAFDALGGKIYHGSNTIYNRYCSSKGQMKNGRSGGGQELKPGTAVFTGDAKKHGHIGLFVGNGEVIEAMGARYGVTTSRVTDKRWTYWGELKDVSYDAAEGDPMEEDKKTMPTLRRGDRGEDVRKAQQLLIGRGYSVGNTGTDGIFGPATEKAVKKFQQDWGLEQDGVIGPQTWKMLMSTPEKDKTYTVTIRGLDKSQATEICNNYPGSTMKEE